MSILLYVEAKLSPALLDRVVHIANVAGAELTSLWKIDSGSWPATNSIDDHDVTIATRSDLEAGKPTSPSPRRTA